MQGGGEATKTSVPRFIWIHEVEVAAVREGASSDSLRAAHVRARMHSAYINGESMGSAAADVVLLSEGMRRAAMEDTDSPTMLRRIAAKGVI